MEITVDSLNTKSSKLDPLKPSRADYRFLKKLLSSSYGGKIEHTPDSYALLCRVFLRAGGSWERIFLGSSKDMGLLKSIIKIAHQKGYIPKAPDWR